MIMRHSVRMRLPRSLDRLGAQVKPLVPARLWPAVRSLASLTGEGPRVGLPPLRRPLVLAPHPDDETLGPGGTLARLAAEGAAVTVLVLTDGEATPRTGLGRRELGRRRREEAGVACQRLGLSQPRFLGHPDGGLAEREAEVAGALAALVSETGADAVFLPWFGDGHPDHRVPTAALGRAGVTGNVEVWAYEVWAPLPANRLVDVTPVMARKREALAAHRMASASFNLEALLALNRYRSVHGLGGHGWAEAFLVGSVEEYLELAALARGR